MFPLYTFLKYNHWPEMGPHKIFYGNLKEDAMLRPRFILGNKDGGLLTLFILEPILGIAQMCHMQKLSAEKIKLTKITLKKLCNHVIQILLEDTKNEGSVDGYPIAQVFR